LLQRQREIISELDNAVEAGNLTDYLQAITQYLDWAQEQSEAFTDLVGRDIELLAMMRNAYFENEEQGSNDP